MEQFLTALPTTIIGWISTIIVVVGAVLYLISRVRRNDMKVLREANDDLRKRDEDRTKEMQEMHIEIATLIAKVDVLEKRNKTLEDLVVVALKQYFFENPSMAGQIEKAIK